MHRGPEWIWFTSLALSFWGATGITQKLATNRISSELSFLWFAWAMIAVSVVLILVKPFHWHATGRVIALAVAAGTLNGMGTLTSFAALEAGGKASVVTALISLYPLLTVGVAVLVLHERPTSSQIIGIGLAMMAAILLSLEPTNPGIIGEG